MRVAVYTGVIPSTTFVENLLTSLAQKNVQTFIFGKKNDKKYYENPKLKFFYVPDNKFKKIIYIIFHGSIFLLKNHHFFLKTYKYYNSLSKKESGGLINWLSKVLPVINNLPDIFHLQWAKSLSFWFFLKEIFGVKIIVSLRGAHINYSPLSDNHLKSNYLNLFPRVDKFHAVSNAISRVAQKYGAKKNAISIIYSGVNIKNLNQIDSGKPYVNNTFSFISVGRAHWKKGYHYSISAFSKVILSGIKAKYTIILSNDPSEEILYQIEDLNLNKYIKIITRIKQNDIYRRIKNSDCLLLPSVEEGIANVVLESMAVGTLVISSDCGGMKEIIQNNFNGLIFESRNVTELTEKMKHVIKLHENQKIKIISNARQTIHDNHDLNVLGSKMKKLYQNALL